MASLQTFKTTLVACLVVALASGSLTSAQGFSDQIQGLTSGLASGLAHGLQGMSSQGYPSQMQGYQGYQQHPMQMPQYQGYNQGYPQMPGYGQMMMQPQYPGYQGYQGYQVPQQGQSGGLLGLGGLLGRLTGGL